jgi:hypothetical protein
VVGVAAFQTPDYQNPDTARTIGSREAHSRRSRLRERFRVSGFEESKDSTLLHR